MSALTQAIALLMNTFDKYAGKEGQSNTLTKAELAELLRNELPVKGNNEALDSFFSTLDNDSDGVVDFMEFVTFVTTLAVIIKE